ncbi:MAG: tRNA (guanosine(46)-N7)-methyltransferase TrmB [Planctomycetota bacterium]|nr:tRNA (guanosine(46)-N7)-methyltransferase TrmB [Planctomycetota bacterium]
MSFSLARGRPLDTTGYGLEMTDLPAFDPSDRAASRLDPRNWFTEPTGRFEIEIGSGKGTFLVQQAALREEVSYLGIEHAGEFYRYAADRVRRRRLANVRILHADAAEFLHYYCADAVAAVIHVYFPDPWPKKRHHKRRIVQDRTLADFHRVLVDGGEVRLVTDHEGLWEWCEEHIARHADLFDRRPFEAPESAGENELVGTNYERKFAREDRPFHAMTLRKR